MLQLQRFVSTQKKMHVCSRCKHSICSYKRADCSNNFAFAAAASNAHNFTFATAKKVSFAATKSTWQGQNCLSFLQQNKSWHIGDPKWPVALKSVLPTNDKVSASTVQTTSAGFICSFAGTDICRCKNRR